MSEKQGGRRRGAGRKPLDPSEKKKPVTVWLGPDEREHCEQLGDNVQDGIRHLISESMKEEQSCCDKA